MDAVSPPAAFVPPPPPFATVLVTGGAGFIGSRVVPLLSLLGVKQIVVDNGYVGMPLPRASETVIPVDADIRDRDGMKAIFAEHRPDAVLHLAAVHHIPTCEKQPYLAFDVNVMGTQSLLEAAEAAGTMSITMASSGAVYDWNEGPLDEATSPLRASDVYSITKLANEAQVGGWADRTGGRARLVRLFNTIGTHDPNGHLIPDILAQISSGAERPVVRLGNTAPKRDYIFVDDVAAGFVTVLGGMLEGEARETFNLCTGDELNVAELVALIGDIMGVSVTIESDPSRFRKIDRLQQLGDPTKLRQRHGWHAGWNLRQALARIIGDLGYPVTQAAKAA